MLDYEMSPQSQLYTSSLTIPAAAFITAQRRSGECGRHDAAIQLVCRAGVSWRHPEVRRNVDEASVSQPVSQTDRLSVCLSVCMSVCLSACLHRIAVTECYAEKCRRVRRAKLRKI